MTNNRPDQAGGPATSTALIIVNLDNVDSPPMVGITSPADGDGVSGASVTITADATDENGVERVEFWVDSTWIREDTDGTHGWSAIWDLTSVADGHCSITATASDGW